MVPPNRRRIVWALTLSVIAHLLFLAAYARMSDWYRVQGGKHVRYAMEILSGAFPAALRKDLYPIFADVQERLGDINDHAAAIALFTPWLETAQTKESRSALSELIALEEKAFKESSEEFRLWLTAERVEELKRRFAEMLEGTSPRSKKKKPAPRKNEHDPRENER